MALKWKKPDPTARLSVSLPRSLRSKLLMVQADAAIGDEGVQVTLSEVLEKLVTAYWEMDKDMAKLEKEVTKAARKSIDDQLDVQEGKAVESDEESKPAAKPAEPAKTATASTPAAAPAPPATPVSTSAPPYGRPAI